MALEENNNTHLVELSGSDYEVVDGEPNINGWAVKNEMGQRIGEVDDLLFDPASRKVRYIIVDLDSNQLDLERDKKVLVPIGVAKLYIDGKLQDQDHKTIDEDNVVVVSATSVKLGDLPAYYKGELGPDNETAVRRVFEGFGPADQVSGGPIYTRDDFYSHEHFNTDKFYNKKKLPIGRDVDSDRVDPDKTDLS